MCDYPTICLHSPLDRHFKLLQTIILKPNNNVDSRTILRILQSKGQ